jgi:hypothetical protein
MFFAVTVAHRGDYSLIFPIFAISKEGIMQSLSRYNNQIQSILEDLEESFYRLSRKFL